MKYAVLIPDGVSGVACPELQDRTPLQAAETPQLDALARSGRLGCWVRGPGDQSTLAESILGVLGYDPSRHLIGSARSIALARDMSVAECDELLCCSLISVSDGRMMDSTVRHITVTEVQSLLNAVQTAAEHPFRFHACGAAQHLCAWQDAPSLDGLQTMPPDRIVGERLCNHAPKGPGSDQIRRLMNLAEAALGEHDVNVVRQDLGESPANAIWIWGNGALPNPRLFHERFGVRGSFVAARDEARGVAKLVGMAIPELPSAVEREADDLGALAALAVRELDSCDLVCVHVPTAFTAGARGDLHAKADALQRFDSEVVGPVVSRLEREPEWRLLVIPARVSATIAGKVTALPAPMLLAGTGIESNRGDAYDEENASEGELRPERVNDLMEYFLRR